MAALLKAWQHTPRPVIGMVHLMALPGAPGYAGERQAILGAALRDAEALAEGGVHGLMLENLGDAPFFPRRVPVSVVAQMTAVAVAIRRRFESLPLGINVLRNDGLSALAVAQAAGAELIRVNILCGARVTDQGLLEGIAHRLLRERERLGAGSIRILADVNVKHSAPLAERPLQEEVADLVHRGGADAVIVSGPASGKPAVAAELLVVRRAAAGRPVLVGSGVTAENVAQFLPHADGFIVGTALKRDGDASGPVDTVRVSQLMAQPGLT